MTEITEVSQPRADRSFGLLYGLPIVIVGYLMFLSAYLSSRRMMWLDEFFAWGVLTDPSLRHAMHAWQEGADSGGALYYILGHTLLKITGPNVLAARLFGAVLLAGAFVLWFRVLRQVFDNRLALISSGVLLISTTYIDYLAEVRFYSQLIAAVVLAVWLVFWCQKRSRPFWSMFGLSFLVHGALVSSHLLGIVYSAMVLAALLLCTKPMRYIAAAGGIVTSWGLLLFARQPIRVGGVRVAGMHLSAPSLLDLFHIYQTQPTASYKLNLLLYLLLFVTAVQWFRERSTTWPFQDDARSLLVRISLLLGAAPAIFFAESWLAPWPLWVARYMLPVILGISGLTGFMLEYQSRRLRIQQLSGMSKNFIFALALLMILALHMDAVRHQTLRPRFTDVQLHPIEIGLPVVVDDEQLFFQLKLYESNGIPQVYYLHGYLPFASPEQYRDDLMMTLERQGYWGGGLRTRGELLGTVHDFLLLEHMHRDADLVAALQSKGWTVTVLGIGRFEGIQMPILRLTEPRP